MYRTHPFLSIIPPVPDCPPVQLRLKGLESWANDLDQSWPHYTPAQREVAVEAFASCVDQLRADVRAGAG
jgi:hypothetical protein